MATQPLAKITKSEIIIEKKVILDEIAKNKKFKEGNVVLKKWEGEEDTNMFISDIKTPESKYIGIVDGSLKRESYGLNTFKNGDRYFGFFSDDLREKHGVFEWKPITKGKQTERELYYGLWKKDQRQDHGIYLWLNEAKEAKPFSCFDDANFDAFVGMMNKDKMSQGVYLSKQGENFYVYSGGFDEKGKKSGDNAFFYSSAEDVLMYGKAANDQFHSGFTAKFNDNGEIQAIVKVTAVEKDNVLEKNVIVEESIPKEEVANARTVMEKFRNVILIEDYFGEVYAKFSQVTAFMDNQMKNLDILDSSEGFNQLMMIVTEHYKKSIYKVIEKHIYNR